MTVSRYRLTKTGWIGAAMFTLPTPIAAWQFQDLMASFAARSAFDRRLESLSGVVAVPEFSSAFFTTLATASLIGLVMVLVGREIETV